MKTFSSLNTDSVNLGNESKKKFYMTCFFASKIDNVVTQILESHNHTVYLLCLSLHQYGFSFLCFEKNEIFDNS